MPSSNFEKSTLFDVFMSTKASVVRMVSRIVPPKEIEDIVQETYVRICQLENHESILQPKSFVLKTARNLALDHIKKAETRLADYIEDESDYSSATTTDVDELFEQAASNEEFAHFCESVRQLPQQCRRVFVLKKVYGYSQKEIAKELQISESTVEKHIADGLKRCTLYMLQQQTNGSTHKDQQIQDTRGMRK
ncbi:RNA polymerase sigma factor [Paraglaciecola sp.]|uniref:RNA polymerase sigma factor n=1 Tax=Paraglaciecola sp. TaxID=1920173 RepID=UPI0030F44D62